MILGIDFDNTLVCYDGLFHAAAVAEGLLSPDGPRDKNGVREALIRQGREDDFTRLQGRVYGRELRNARPYPGALDCLRRLKANGATLYVISHKTRFPVLGPRYDLRRAARDWLVKNGFQDPALLAREDIFFEDTLKDKALRIRALGCTHFIDDLESFFRHPAFPAGVTKLWFRPAAGTAENPGARPSFVSWREMAATLLGDDGV